MNVPVLINSKCEHLRKVKDAVTTVNRLQNYFQLSIVEADWLPNDEYEQKEVTEEHIRRLVERNFQDVPAERPSITVIQNPLDYWQFSSQYRFLSIITVADWESYFAPPPVTVYLAYEFAGALLNFAADIPVEMLEEWKHKPPIGCFFDTFLKKDLIRLGMVGANLCGDCEVKLVEMGLADQAREAIEQILLHVRGATTRRPRATPFHVFIGHGHSKAWIELEDYLTHQLGLEVDEFNREPVAGVTTTERLKQMLDHARFAFLVMTAEEQYADEKLHARENVVHEIGLFQGRLGFDKAIILREEGVTEFSNVYGMTFIDFPKNKLSAAKREIRRTLMHAGIIEPMKRKKGPDFKKGKKKDLTPSIVNHA